MALSIVRIRSVAPPFRAAGGSVTTPADEPGIMVSIPLGKCQLSMGSSNTRVSVRGKAQLSEQGQR